jgi:hypothetical protein
MVQQPVALAISGGPSNETEAVSISIMPDLIPVFDRLKFFVDKSKFYTNGVDFD